ncbi:hemolysin family protein [Chryseomicrobium aureum]|uniref:hemolysin family protein n=1 Tax=Chryseomicrobium aureum TaxID=1441723 RepID=UPI00370D5F84
MDIEIAFNLFMIVFLIAATAFFVGSEFAVVKVRSSRLDQLIAEGNQSAVLAKKVTSDLDYYLSACQLGITVTALGLGFLGKPTVELLLYPVFQQYDLPASVISVLSFLLAFSLVTFLHVVVGELAPKTLAIQFAERMTLLLSRPLYWFGKIMFPFIWFLNGSGRLLLSLFGVKPAGHDTAHSEEELKILMAQSFKSGELNQTEIAFMHNIFAFDEHVARDLMVPRTKMETIDIATTHEEMLQEFEEHQFTRYAITEDYDKDKIIGYINAKEILLEIAAETLQDFASYVKPLPVVSETTQLDKTFATMKANHAHMVLVVDEYGGTAGMLTLEDVLEEIVGEIRDEFDTDEVDDIHEIGPRQYEVDGRVLLSDLTERFSIHFEESEDIETIAGWIHARSLDVQQGDSFSEHNFQLRVIEFEQNHVERVLLTLPDLPETSNSLSEEE